SAIIEAARGMGMTDWQVFLKIQLPLAKSSVFAGLRLASSSIIAIATIASTINAGGLGTILFDGLRTMSMTKLVWGIFLTVGLSLLFNLILY
ncbi:ABC transporter permease subunit, partial [Streptococcus pyogenes]